MIKRSPLVRRVGLVLFVGFLGFTATRFALRTGILTKREGLDPVTRHEQRLTPVRRQLATSGYVGFLSKEQTGTGTLEAPLWGFDSPQALIEYYRTQYVLAPLIVRNTPEGGDVIATSLDAATVVPQCRSSQAFDGGIVLLRGCEP